MLSSDGDGGEDGDDRRGVSYFAAAPSSFSFRRPLPRTRSFNMLSYYVAASTVTLLARQPAYRRGVPIPVRSYVHPLVEYLSLKSA